MSPLDRAIYYACTRLGACRVRVRDRARWRKSVEGMVQIAGNNEAALAAIKTMIFNTVRVGY